jgi:transposase
MPSTASRNLTHNGPVWRALPADFPPAWTVYYSAAKWQADGSVETMHGHLRDRVRQVAGRTTAPTAAIIDSQSVKAAEEVAQASRGYDAGKKTSTAANGTSPSTHGATSNLRSRGAERRRLVQSAPGGRPARPSLSPWSPAITTKII